VAVYTDISDAELEAFLARYDLGAPISFKGIAEGVENSNFLLETDRGRYFLTIYERRVRAEDLPFFLGFMQHLAQQAGGDGLLSHRLLCAATQSGSLPRGRPRAGLAPRGRCGLRRPPRQRPGSTRLGVVLRAAARRGRRDEARPGVGDRGRPRPSRRRLATG